MLARYASARTGKLCINPTVMHQLADESLKDGYAAGRRGDV